MENFVIILHNIRSCYNVGSIFRSADAFLVDKIFLGGYTPTPENPKVQKTALGAENFVKWEKFWHTWKLLEILKNKGYFIAALEIDSKSKPIHKFQPKFPLALVLGNEVNGLSEKILRRCNEILEIKMYGKKKSLNVAVAFGIAAFYFSLFLPTKHTSCHGL